MNKAEGIVIRSTDYGEANKIVTLYTREFGKIGVMGRGAKKPRSKLAASTQLMTHGHYLYSKGRGLGTLYQGDPINPFRYIKADIEKMAYAAYIIDMVDKLGDRDTQNPFLFEWILQLLTYIDEGVDPRVLTYIFEVKMLPVLGIEAELDRCTQCGGTDGPYAFSVDNGGFLCRNCRGMDSRAFPLSPAASKLLRLFKHIDLKRIGKIELKQETMKEIKIALSSYYDAYSGLNLKTKRFIDQIEALETPLDNQGD